MSMAPLWDLADSASVVGLTLEQYVQMIKMGILLEGEPIELLDGFLVRKDRSKAGEDPMTVGLEHMWAVKNLGRVLNEVERHGLHVALQQPIALPPDGAPEPDGSIVKGTPDDYLAVCPTFRDVPCVVEVADSSLHHDRVTKKRIYAKGGIAQYVIVNLIDRVVEVWDAPVTGADRYLRDAILRPGEIVQFSIGGGKTADIEVSRLFPARKS